jgi:hypothetical protein
MKKLGIDAREALVRVGGKREIAITPGLEAILEKLSD